MVRALSDCSIDQIEAQCFLRAEWALGRTNAARAEMPPWFHTMISVPCRHSSQLGSWFGELEGEEGGAILSLGAVLVHGDVQDACGTSTPIGGRRDGEWKDQGRQWPEVPVVLGRTFSWSSCLQRMNVGRIADPPAIAAKTHASSPDWE